MKKSKFTLSACVIIFLMLFILILLPIIIIWGFIDNVFDDTIIKLIILIFISIGTEFLMWEILNSTYKRVTITNDGIIIKNIFNKNTSIIFNELDGYIEAQYSDQYGENYYVLYFIKNGKKVESISSAAYTNFYEMQEILILKNLGFFKPNYIDQVKGYFEMRKYRRKYLNNCG